MQSAGHGRERGPSEFRPFRQCSERLPRRLQPRRSSGHRHRAYEASSGGDSHRDVRFAYPRHSSPQCRSSVFSSQITRRGRCPSERHACDDRRAVEQDRPSAPNHHSADIHGVAAEPVRPDRQQILGFKAAPNRPAPVVCRGVVLRYRPAHSATPARSGTRPLRFAQPGLRPPLRHPCRRPRRDTSSGMPRWTASSCPANTIAPTRLGIPQRIGRHYRSDRPPSRLARAAGVSVDGGEATPRDAQQKRGVSTIALLFVVGTRCLSGRACGAPAAGSRARPQRAAEQASRPPVVCGGEARTSQGAAHPPQNRIAV
jgi:hypothetical protein